MAERPQSRPRGRPPKDQSGGREALLLAAISAFARHGFVAADLRGIAAAAGVSPNLIRVHFGSKAGLWMACVDKLAEAMTPALEVAAELAEGDPRPLTERLRDAVTLTSDYYDAFPDVRDFVLRISADDDERAAIVTEKILRPAYEASRPLIAAGMEAGIIRGAHPALVYVLLNSMLSQPPRFPEFIGRIDAGIAPAQARSMLIETIIATFFHQPLTGAGHALTV
ncbi:MAG: TetR/AcrR family transcriptional regulator [Loktanella sp.]|nr:TetR/AcrR family transcriptional regulator [Loktanella sp.]